ncbi:hypothetical protein L486_07315 [Kwoniella mangroviensis CBS 10435]|uniref:Uncharacterized protein n=1 Tax=Kwoniella mangroviensis CBS 10435 TaxID=1331196 RepID=A0A1B9II34_9TREE|nr:hypothetical protein L486_07315 [Kwoniella mangroviensis CBS 10435]
MGLIAIFTFVRWFVSHHTHKLLGSKPKPERKANTDIDTRPWRPLPTLPDEIWRDIFLLVAEPTYNTPPCWQRGYDGYMMTGGNTSTGKDLATCMRVSTTFNRVASDILYNEIPTSDPYRFFYGIDYTPPNENRNRMSKIQCLSKVKRISLVYPKSYSKPTPSFSGDFQWMNLSIYRMPQSQEDKKYLKMYLQALDSASHAYQILAKIRTEGPMMMLGVGMGNIGNIIIGKMPYKATDCLWLFNNTAIGKLSGAKPKPSLEDKIVKDLLERKEEISMGLSRELYYITSMSRYRQVCYHSNFGPWNYLPPPSLDRLLSRGVRYTPTQINIFMNNMGKFFGQGTTNNWIICKSLFPFYSANQWTSSIDEQVGRTVVELFKIFRNYITKFIKSKEFAKSQQRSRIGPTRLNIILPVNINSLRLAANILKHGSQPIVSTTSTVSQKDRMLIYSRLEGWLMNKGVAYYHARGLSIHVRESTEGKPVNLDRTADQMECSCCGSIEYV